MKVLFLSLGSYKVKDTTGFDADNFDRQLLYSIALNNLCQLVKPQMDILVVENTAGSKEELHEPLRQALSLPQITDVLFSKNNSLGTKNKGAGEYGMCQFAYLQRKDLFDSADWVVYYTHRHVLSFPLIFQYLEKFSEHDAIVSSARYLYPDGSCSVNSDTVFDDVIFAMKKNVFIDYMASMNPELLVKKHIGSEQNLRNFLNSSNYNYKQVERFGIFRYNYYNFQMEVI